MKQGDVILQHWRIRMAARHLPRGAHVLDIGCCDGLLFSVLKGRIASGVGVDTDSVPDDYGDFRFIRGRAPDDLPSGETFDAIMMLAVLEHIPADAQRSLAEDCRELLNDNGRVICTVPSPKVDRLIDLGKRLRILDGMQEQEHYGFEPSHTVQLFVDRGFTLLRARRFQFGLNNLFVFTKGSSQHAGESPGAASDLQPVSETAGQRPGSISE
ncbi:MAG: methyltransferase domain-containing protein [Solirubrobacterales bacterium]|nr:methyltransferase domain-containing protein [Solirubrobacterales bacterium]